MRFIRTDSSLFFSRNDPNDQRLGDLVKATEVSSVMRDQNKRTYALLGYPDDEGIRINGGRAGAAQGPLAIRKSFYKMTPPLLGGETDFAIQDLGDLDPKSASLAERHDGAAKTAQQCLSRGLRWLSLGGGHDYGFADADGFLTWALSAGLGKPLVINFDAHLDVRPTDRGLSSGTPFFRMLEKFPQTDFIEIGLQSQCNAKSHLQWAKDKGARILTQDEILSRGELFLDAVKRVMGDWLTLPRPCFLSVDIDGFSSAFAPGCSQSWATGFTPHDFFPCLDFLLKTLDVRALGIYEVSPPLDQDDRTAKLAAQILHRVVTSAGPKI